MKGVPERLHVLALETQPASRVFYPLHQRLIDDVHGPSKLSMPPNE